MLPLIPLQLGVAKFVLSWNQVNLKEDSPCFDRKINTACSIQFQQNFHYYKSRPNKTHIVIFSRVPIRHTCLHRYALRIVAEIAATPLNYLTLLQINFTWCIYISILAHLAWMPKSLCNHLCNLWTVLSTTGLIIETSHLVHTHTSLSVCT